MLSLADELVSGVVLPSRQVELSFSSTARIVELMAIGQAVEQGEVIGRLDDRQMGASLRAAEASVKIARFALQKSRHDRDKKTRLSNEEIISAMAIIEAEFDVERASEELNLSLAKLSAAQLSMSDCLLIAPFSGVIIDNYLSASENVSSGTPVISFADLTELSLTVDVPYALSSSLNPDTETTIEQNGEIMGKVKVSTIMPLIDPASGLRRVIWHVEESYVDLLSGRYVTLTPW